MITVTYYFICIVYPAFFVYIWCYNSVKQAGQVAVIVYFMSEETEKQKNCKWLAKNIY